jgi:DNA repair protein RecO (recombination protein O)
MSGTYKAIGINLKSSPLGESDRLLTVLTDEYGLMRVAAPGARKHRSSLGGRSSLFVINQLLLAKGRTIDKIVQAESLESFPGLSQDLAKLTAAQYLAELVLFQALSDHPQTELFCLLREHLGRLASLPASATLAGLTHAAFHLLALAGLTPQIHACCLTQQPLLPASASPVGFSVMAGGVIRLDQLEHQPLPRPRLRTPSGTYRTSPEPTAESTASPPLSKAANLLLPLTPIDLDLLQQLTQPNLIQTLVEADSEQLAPSHQQNWLTLERVLRHYAQYHFERPIRSAALIDVCFAAADTLSPV